MNITLVGDWGRVEALVNVPRSNPRAVVVVAPPQPDEGSMRSRVAYEVAQGFVRAGAATVRFNFPGVGLTTAAPGNGHAGAIGAFRVALDEAVTRFPGLPVWAAGCGLGAWVAAVVTAEGRSITSWLGIAPLVDEMDFQAILAGPFTKFIIQPEFDQRSPLKAVHRFYARLAEPRELVVIDGANHAFDGHASQVGDAVEDLYADVSV